MTTRLILLVSLATLGAPGCRAPADNDLGEIKQLLAEQVENQKAVVARLDKLEKQAKTARPRRPARPEVDYDKVHQIPTSDSPIKGKPAAKVTIAAFSDFQ
ncbi:MAG: hypothetical protein B7733_13965 [Myxococcales bacterium FL481]|nr:MAG: hypothetical protein B7733_13965 [Myxococcales bacterium FL481]